MKKHPLLFNFILTMAIQIGVYLIEIFEVQIIEPLLQALGCLLYTSDAADEL